MTSKQFLTAIKKQRPLIPLLILAGFCIDVIIKALFSYSVLTTKNYIAIVVVGANFITYFQFRQFYKYTFVVTILVGLLNIIMFSAGEFGIRFSFNNLKISFQLHSFIVGLLTYIMNFRRTNEFILDNLVTKLTPEEEELNEKLRFAEALEKFKWRYERYSTDYLIEIVTENKFVPEAIEAARQLLNERQKK